MSECTSLVKWGVQVIRRCETDLVPNLVPRNEHGRKAVGNSDDLLLMIAFIEATHLLCIEEKDLLQFGLEEDYFHST